MRERDADSETFRHRVLRSFFGRWEESDHNRSKLISPAWSVLPLFFLCLKLPFLLFLFIIHLLLLFSSRSRHQNVTHHLSLLLNLQCLDLCCVDRRNLFTKERKSAYEARDRFWFNFSADNFVCFQSLRHQRRRERERKRKRMQNCERRMRPTSKLSASMKSSSTSLSYWFLIDHLSFPCHESLYQRPFDLKDSRSRRRLFVHHLILVSWEKWMTES